MRHLFAILTLAFLATVPVAFAAVPAAGEIILLTGRGSAISADGAALRELHKGDKVYSGETLNAAANTYINVKFADGGFVLLRPNTRFSIENYAYNEPSEAEKPKTAPPEPAAPATPKPNAVAKAPEPVQAPPPPLQNSVSHAFFRLLKGGFRTVSGLIGKANPQDYRVSTPVATIGIRGTDYYVYICDQACADDPVIAQSFNDNGIAPAQAAGSTLAGVIKGTIFVTNKDGQSQDLSADQFLITLPDGAQVRLPYEPRFLRVQPFPDPVTLCSE